MKFQCINAVLIVGSKLWDDLPMSDIELPVISSFKQRIKSKNRADIDVLV